MSTEANITSKTWECLECREDIKSLSEWVYKVEVWRGVKFDAPQTDGTFVSLDRFPVPVVALHFDSSWNGGDRIFHDEDLDPGDPFMCAVMETGECWRVEAPINIANSLDEAIKKTASTMKVSVDELSPVVGGVGWVFNWHQLLSDVNAESALASLHGEGGAIIQSNKFLDDKAVIVRLEDDSKWERLAGVSKVALWSWRLSKKEAVFRWADNIWESCVYEVQNMGINCRWNCSGKHIPTLSPPDQELQPHVNEEVESDPHVGLVIADRDTPYGSMVIFAELWGEIAEVKVSQASGFNKRRIRVKYVHKWSSALANGRGGRGIRFEKASALDDDDNEWLREMECVDDHGALAFITQLTHEKKGVGWLRM